jgi:hypothetical protein
VYSFNPRSVKFHCAKRREFSGIIHWLTIKQIIPATPSNPSIPYVKRTSKKKAGKFRVATVEREMIGISFGFW